MLDLHYTDKPYHIDDATGIHYGVADQQIVLFIWKQTVGVSQLVFLMLTCFHGYQRGSS